VAVETGGGGGGSGGGARGGGDHGGSKTKVGRKGQQHHETTGDSEGRGIAVDAATPGVWTALAEAEAHAEFTSTLCARLAHGRNLQADNHCKANKKEYNETCVG
jgi:hypothetical protein